MTDASSRSGRAVRAQGRAPWWLWAVLGVLSVVTGVIVLVRPGHSLTTLAVVMGIFMLVESVFELASALDPTEDRPRAGLIAVLGVVAGILLVRHPIAGITGIALLLGIWLLAIGTIRLAGIVAVQRRASTALLAIVQIVAGIVIVASPGIGFTALAVIAGIAFIANGFALTGLGWALRLLGEDERAQASPAHGGSAPA